MLGQKDEQVQLGTALFGVLAAAGMIAGLAGRAFAGAPANDLCVNAFDLNSVINGTTIPPYQTYHTLIDASLATSDALYFPGFDFDAELEHGVWYTFTAPVPGYFYYSEPNSLLGLDAITANADCEDGTAIQEGFDPSVFASSLYGFVNAGENINVVVYSGITGLSDPEMSTTNYDPTFSFVPSIVPANDDCVNATDLAPLGFPYSATIDNILANDDSTDCSALFHGVWFTYTPSWTGYIGVWETGKQEAAWAVDNSDLPPDDVPKSMRERGRFLWAAGAPGAKRRVAQQRV